VALSWPPTASPETAKPATAAQIPPQALGRRPPKFLLPGGPQFGDRQRGQRSISAAMASGEAHVGDGFEGNTHCPTDAPFEVNVQRKACRSATCFLGREDPKH